MNGEAAAQLLHVLEKTTSPDQAELTAAQTFLEQFAASNLGELLKALSDILVHGGHGAVARRQAGLQLKNRLTSHDANTKVLLQQRWLELDENVRVHIKNNIVGVLGAEGYRPSAAAQCVQMVAVVELPRNMWPNLLQVLVTNVTNPSSTEMCKEATLEAIGYICADIDHNCLESKSNEILTAIVHAMKSSEPSNHVRLAATNALLNSLEFTRSNFETKAERDYIMQVVCETTQASDIKVRVAALQCLVKIMSLYYEFMEAYMGPGVFAITLDAMKSSEDEVALQGIEFWSNVCDEESDLQIEALEAQELGRTPEHVSRFYAKGALQFIVPVLMESLAKQEEFDDEDDWNPCKASGVCLMLLASCCEDDVVPHVLPFVNANIKNSDWRFRDAAVMAFGSILEGPDSAKMKPYVEQAMPMLIQLMHDPSVVVRDTAAWTIGRVCDLHSEAAVQEVYLKPLLEALVRGLSSEPRVAANVCWAFNSLAESAYEKAVEKAKEEQSESTDASPRTYALSAFFDPIVEKLLETTDRPDAGTANLRSAAYEALMEMIKNSPRDCYLTVQKTILIILNRLEQVLQMESRVQTQSDRVQFNDLQSLLCASLQSVLRKVEPEHAPQISDPIMSALLRMFRSSMANKTGGVVEDALMAVGTVTEILGENFSKYMEDFKPFLLLGLKNVAEHQVCLAAVGLVGDLCRALGRNLMPYCDEIMVILLENLRNHEVHRSVKPHILSVFGDLAMAIGPDFKKYLDVVLPTLMQAAQAQVDKNDFDMVDYLNELRVSCIEAYTGIIQGLKGDQNVAQAASDLAPVQHHINFVVSFVITMAQDNDTTDVGVASCAGLIGDLCGAFGASILPLLDVEPITELLTRGRRSKMSRTKSLSQWATKEIRKLRNITISNCDDRIVVRVDEGQTRMRVVVHTSSFISQVSEESVTIRLPRRRVPVQEEESPIRPVEADPVVRLMHSRKRRQQPRREEGEEEKRSKKD